MAGRVNEEEELRGRKRLIQEVTKKRNVGWYEKYRKRVES